MIIDSQLEMNTMIAITLTTIDRFVWTLCMCTSAPILITDDREVCVNVYVHYCHHTLSSLHTYIIALQPYIIALQCHYRTLESSSQL